MTVQRLGVCGVLSSVVLLGAAGCLTRQETIRIARDGTVAIEVHYEGKPEEFDSADALPSTMSGWKTTTNTEKDGDEEKQILTAERTFAPGDQLPSSYAPNGDPDADLYLEFPTTLDVVEQADGTYYSFRRVYQPRRWGYVRYWEDEWINDDIKKLGEKPAEELTLADKLQIARAFTSLEASKQIEFARAALDERAPDFPPVHRLLARQALLDVYVREDLNDFNDVFKRCEQMPEDQIGGCFDREAERILAAGYAAFVESLRDSAGLGPAQIAAFEGAYGRAERYYEITDELGGHAFMITVELPGTLIAHNGEIEEKDGIRVVSWAFEGDAFRDRPQELLAISRVASERETELEDAPDDNGR